MMAKLPLAILSSMRPATCTELHPMGESLAKGRSSSWYLLKAVNGLRKSFIVFAVNVTAQLHWARLCLTGRLISTAQPIKEGAQSRAPQAVARYSSSPHTARGNGLKPYSIASREQRMELFPMAVWQLTRMEACMALPISLVI